MYLASDVVAINCIAHISQVLLDLDCTSITQLHVNIKYQLTWLLLIGLNSGTPEIANVWWWLTC